MTRVVIAGAGIAGLSIAWALRRRDPDLEVLVLERSPRTGGNIHTAQIDGYLCEAGPDGFLDNAPATLTLVEEMGLSSRLLRSNDAARKRYLVHRGQLCEVPLSVRGFLRTPLLSPAAKVRLALEPFAHHRPGAEESIHQFARRRIGEQAAAVFVDPMVSGIFAGDASALSLRACFPRMWELEEKHGGLVRAMLATRRGRQRGAAVGAPAGHLTSFVGGMSDLTGALTRALGPAVRTSTPLVGVSRRHALALGSAPAAAGRYSVMTHDDRFEADAIVLSGPAGESAAVLQALDPVLAANLQNIPTAPIAVVCLGYDQARIAPRCTLDGFGFLAARGNGLRILGALWETSIYRHRAPAGKALLRVMIGGATDRQAVALPDDELLDIVRRDLARIMGVTDAPEFVRVIRHARGIPQYVKGHLERLHRIETLLQAHPGIFLAGNSYRGVSINACIADADLVAGSVIRWLSMCKGRPSGAVSRGS
jgi:oxygen-dependent protoporphyrinogen oxidase